MRIVHFSDIHFGAEDPALVEACARRVGELAPDLVVASGDFTMAGRPREYRAAAAFLDAMPAPVLAVPGNHDLPVYNLAERFLAPLRRYRRFIAPRSVREFVRGPVAMLGLNSARPWDLSFNWSHGRLSRAQIRRADAFFARHAQAAFRALVVHHPFHVPEDLPGFRTIGNAEPMLRVLARRGVHAVLSGHLHRQFRASRTLTLDTGEHEIALLQVSTVASTRGRNQPNAFALLEVGEGTFRFVEQVWSGGAFRAGEARRGAADR